MMFTEKNEKRIELFREYHNAKNRQPLMGACIGGWEGFGRYVKDTAAFIPKGPVGIDKIVPDRFKSMYRDYITSLEYPDDLLRSVEPVQAIPWAEAAAGIQIEYTGLNFWARGEKTDIKSLSTPLAEHNPWIERYGEFVSFLSREYGHRFPVAQSILRGPLDILAAAIGDENMIYALYDQPEEVHYILSIYSGLIKAFLRIQKDMTPPFMEGNVIGQYHIWAPGTVARLQEDAQSLLSAKLYEEFVLPCDCDIASENKYNLFHMHASAFHLLDLVLMIKNIGILQVSKDEGINSIESMIPGLVKIQKAGRKLILKGRLTLRDVELIKKKLDYGGLCLQFVVSSIEEADTTISSAMNCLR